MFSPGWRHNIERKVSDSLTSWVLDPCGGRHWIRNRIRWVPGASGRWGCPRWTPRLGPPIKAIKRSKTSPSFLSFFPFFFFQLGYKSIPRGEMNTMTSLGSNCVCQFLQVDRERSCFSGVELQSKRDEAENRTILGRNGLLPTTATTTTYTLQPGQQSPNLLFFGGVSCAEFLSSWKIKKKKKLVSQGQQKHTQHTHTEHVGNGGRW